MRYSLVVVILALLCCAIAAQAGTYTISLPEFAATYGTSDPYELPPPPISRTFAIDFGRAFSSIQSVSISWAGQNNEGVQLNLFTYNLEPYEGSFAAYLKEGSNTLKEVVDGGALVNGAFSETRTFAAYGGTTNWDFLLDGTADLLVGYSPYIYADVYEVQSNCYGSLDSVSLTLEGTEVPEPSGIGILLAGVIGAVCRRRRF